MASGSTGRDSVVKGGRAAHRGLGSWEILSSTLNTEQSVSSAWGEVMNSRSVLLPPRYTFSSKPPSFKGFPTFHKQCHKLRVTKFSNVWAHKGDISYSNYHTKYMEDSVTSKKRACLGVLAEKQLHGYPWLKTFLSVGTSSSLAKSMWGRDGSLLMELEHLNTLWWSMRWQILQPEPPHILHPRWAECDSFKASGTNFDLLSKREEGWGSHLSPH